MAVPSSVRQADNLSFQSLNADARHDDDSSDSRFSTAPEREVDDEIPNAGYELPASIRNGGEGGISHRDANDQLDLKEPEDNIASVETIEAHLGNQVCGHYEDNSSIPSEVTVMHNNQDQAILSEPVAGAVCDASMPLNLSMFVNENKSFEYVLLSKGVKADPSVMKPKMNVGQRVFAKWSPNNKWYHGKIFSVEKEVELSPYGPSYKYGVLYDDGDTDSVSEGRVVHEREYPLLSEANHYWKRMEERLQSDHGLLIVHEPRSMDQWFAKFGYYVISIGNQKRAYTYLHQALLAHDAHVVEHSYPQVSLTDLALPNEWAKHLGMEVHKEEKNIIQKEKKTRKSQCRQCAACRREDCGKCENCVDKKKFGGPDKKRQKCVHRLCENMS